MLLTGEVEIECMLLSQPTSVLCCRFELSSGTGTCTLMLECL